MKKIKQFVLTLLIIISLVSTLTACNKNSIEERIVGTWTYEYIEDGGTFWQGLDEVAKEFFLDNGNSLGVGETFLETIEIYKGGTGYIIYKNMSGGEDQGGYTLKWEITEGNILVISYESTSGMSNLGLEYHEDTDTLTDQRDKSKQYSRQQ